MLNTCYITIMSEITGTSVCLLSGEHIVAILRDNQAGLPYANHWDLPGGALEPGEDPLVCGLREVFEETGVVVPASNIAWEQNYPFEKRLGFAKFIVASLSAAEVPKLGNEGQETRFMLISEFLSRQDVVPAQQDRLREYLHSRQTVEATDPGVVQLPRPREELELQSA
jgi:8-oxo-dGTP diphosphatase